MTQFSDEDKRKIARAYSPIDTLVNVLERHRSAVGGSHGVIIGVRVHVVRANQRVDVGTDLPTGDDYQRFATKR